MNIINVSLMGTAAVIILSQGWLSLFKTWVQSKVAETHTGQTQT